MFALAMRRPGASSEIPMPVACVGLIHVCVGAPDGTSNLLLLGLKRVQCTGGARYKPYRLERVERLENAGEDAAVCPTCAINWWKWSEAALVRS